MCSRSSAPHDSSDESGISLKVHVSEAGETEERTASEETLVATDYRNACPPSPRKINKNILKAQLVGIDRNSIGSCYDNVLLARQKEDEDSEASVEETDLIDDFHDSDVEPSDGPGKESDVIQAVPLEEAETKDDVVECEDLVDEESLTQESRARETLKNIPANLVCMVLVEVVRVNYSKKRT